jgi:hypothetical protein
VNNNPVLLRDPGGRDPDEQPKKQAGQEDKTHEYMVGKPLPEKEDDTKQPEKKDSKETEEEKDNPAPVTQASRTNQGPNVYRPGQSGAEVQLGGMFSVGGTRPTFSEQGTGGTGQFPIFQTRLGFGLTPWVSLHFVGTVASQGPETPTLEGTTIKNTTPGTLGGFVQIGTPEDTGFGTYLGGALVFGQNPPGTAGNFNLNSLFAYSLGSDKTVKVDLNLLLQYQQFGQVFNNPAANIFTGAPGINFSRPFEVKGGTLTPNLEFRTDLNLAGNWSLPGGGPGTSSIVYSTGAGLLYSNLPGHYSLGINAFMTHEQRLDEKPFGTQVVPQPYNITILPSVSGYF